MRARNRTQYNRVSRDKIRPFVFSPINTRHLKNYYGNYYGSNKTSGEYVNNQA